MPSIRTKEKKTKAEKKLSVETTTETPKVDAAAEVPQAEGAPTTATEPVELKDSPAERFKGEVVKPDFDKEKNFCGIWVKFVVDGKQETAFLSHFDLRVLNGRAYPGDILSFELGEGEGRRKLLNVEVEKKADVEKKPTSKTEPPVVIADERGIRTPPKPLPDEMEKMTWARVEFYNDAEDWAILVVEGYEVDGGPAKVFIDGRVLEECGGPNPSMQGDWYQVTWEASHGLDKRGKKKKPVVNEMKWDPKHPRNLKSQKKAA